MEYLEFTSHQRLVRLKNYLEDLATVGIFVENYTDVISLIGAIQKEAKKVVLEKEVDEMIIKSLKPGQPTLQITLDTLDLDLATTHTLPLQLEDTPI